MEDVFRADSARDTLLHRGPDNCACWTKDGVYMGHRRLSIIDTSPSGNQPMSAGGMVITVNGEIYNFKYLRETLENAGHTFTSLSDSEVVLHGYRYWGLEGLVERLDGMYVAVIYDRNRNRIMAFRDRVGIKPLYYYFDQNSFAWASELKALVEYFGSENLIIDNTAIVDFLACRYVPAPKSIYKNIYKLKPGYVLTYDITEGILHTGSYWQLPLTERNKPYDVLAEELLGHLRESVHQQLVSDVPLGLLLSGGIDSSAVAALASEKKQLHSFSIGFADHAHDESCYAELVATHVGTRHHMHRFVEEEMEDLPNRMAHWFDEPFGDTSAIPTYRVSCFARNNVVVALSGDGGDELFGGYKWHGRYALLRTWNKRFPIKSIYGLNLPNVVPERNTIELLSISDPVVLYARLRGSLPVSRLNKWKSFLGVPIEYDPFWAYREQYCAELSPRKAAQLMDFHMYLPDDILTKIDRVSMAVSLECRPPFLSRNLVEFAFSLPDSFIYKNNQLKGGLKYSLSHLLPSNILNRSKQGFSVPDYGWRKKAVQNSCSLQEYLLTPFFNMSPI